ncbi:MAG: helix-turn-helix domain-containing protein [Lachnospiraceae bacterium]|nr:helix-turn-helix domain-containing protein [Lachnospiraceae bacterium]
MEYHGVAIGGKIYSLRVAKGMTQEELSAVLCISPAAVSKWERNLANPNIEMLWALADFFDCSIDELVGRREERLRQVGAYDDEMLRLAEVADELLVCCEISRQEGLLALEEEMKRYTGSSRFLPFAVRFFMQMFAKRTEFELTFELLRNYAETLPESERAEGRMIADVLRRITAGENPAVLEELIASHIGIGYWEKLEAKNRDLRHGQSREEIIGKYRDKKPYSDKTTLLEELEVLEDFEIRAILRNLDNVTLKAALYGASGKITAGFLANLSDRLLWLVSEDIDSFTGTEEEIVAAQRKVLEIGHLVCGGR